MTMSKRAARRTLSGKMRADRIITIEIFDVTSFTVRVGDLSADHLCWEEMLGQIATLTHSDIKHPRFRMLTDEEHAAEHRRITGGTDHA